jgi:hypothetical protein
MTLDEILIASEEAKRAQQRERIAQMADEIERIKREDWKAPEGVDLMPILPPVAAPERYSRRSAEDIHD